LEHWKIFAEGFAAADAVPPWPSAATSASRNFIRGEDSKAGSRVIQASRQGRKAVARSA
jgi:hypothetical protein